LQLIRGRFQKEKVVTDFLLEGVAGVFFTGIGPGPNRKGILLDRTRKFANLKNQQLLHVSFSEYFVQWDDEVLTRILHAPRNFYILRMDSWKYSENYPL
jgi:hypothetical protein